MSEITSIGEITVIRGEKLGTMSFQQRINIMYFLLDTEIVGIIFPENK